MRQEKNLVVKMMMMMRVREKKQPWWCVFLELKRGVDGK
jgi:hypothetical protein